MRKTTSKERVYDDRLHMLVTEIVQTCQRNGIAMFAIFDISGPENTDLCCSTLIGDENEQIPSHWASTPIAIPASQICEAEDPSGHGRMHHGRPIGTK